VTAAPPAVLPESVFVDAVAAAVLAPSMHNTQPWHFRHDRAAGRIEVRIDRARTLPVADPQGRAARLACGAATYNLRLSCAAHGRPMTLEWLPDNTDPDLVATLQPGPARPATPEESRLAHAITRRHSNRTPFLPVPVPVSARAELVRAAREEGAWIELVSGVVPVAAVAEVTQMAQRVLDRDPAYLAELQAWVRADRTAPDGVPAPAAGLAPQPPDLFPQRPFGEGHDGEVREYERDPLVAVLGTVGDLAVDHLRAGYVLQRVLLTVTDLGLSSSMFSQPIEVPAAREQLRLALGRYGTPQMVLRVGYGEPGPHAARRPVAEVILP
jgi:nitroreductase